MKRVPHLLLEIETVLVSEVELHDRWRDFDRAESELTALVARQKWLPGQSAVFGQVALSHLKDVSRVRKQLPVFYCKSCHCCWNLGGTCRIEEVPAAWILGHDSVREGIPPEVLIPVGEQRENLHVGDDGFPLLVMWTLAFDAPRLRARLWT